MGLWNERSLLLISTMLVQMCGGIPHDMHPGHGRPFGCCSDNLPVKEVEGLTRFPPLTYFFENHILKQQPLLMKGAATMSPAYQKWSDSYLLMEHGSHIVGVEMAKKERLVVNRKYMTMKQYIDIYNTTNVNSVTVLADGLKKDVTIPCPFQCGAMRDRFVNIIMWYSSGGTRSSLHFDNVELVVCEYRGKETYTMFDKYKHKINYTEDPYFDVDAVDYLLFPWMEDVELYQVDVSQGDCLYIPFSWYHQTNSHGSNIAISIHWRHDLSLDRKLYPNCPEVCNASFTADMVRWMGDRELDERPERVREDILDMFYNGPLLDRSSIEKVFYGPEKGDLLHIPKFRWHLDWFISLVDLDKDGQLSMDEVLRLEDKVLVTLGQETNRILADIETLHGIIWGREDDRRRTDEL